MLTLKKKWFDMLLSGEKKEEYREIKPYYTSRFNNLWGKQAASGHNLKSIQFKNGYALDSPSFIAGCTMTKGEGKPEWGAEPGKCYYIIKIEEIYHAANINRTRSSFIPKQK